MTGQVGQDRARIWHATYWRSQPSAGALVWDGRLEDWGATTHIAGKLRRGYAFLPLAIVWPILVFWFLATERFAPAVFLTLLATLELVQLVSVVIRSNSDSQTLLAFVDRLLADPHSPPQAPYPKGIDDPAAAFAERYRFPGRPGGSEDG